MGDNIKRAGLSVRSFFNSMINQTVAARGVLTPRVGRLHFQAFNGPRHRGLHIQHEVQFIHG
jgi:hypothetical protein